ncbi:TetR/AcrR family transcriptional regulator [Amycolatopsis saalfeldensis]|uniref:DNA-binding transcriptional regulator, AcrR family n=1 Tax=Amycolatopsis saalfeldensis TaxID=394193 RepID=A0A1H8VZX4_9PSEU|nr:TetR/AcrR family transcriptional regulator [Amycolatopsis saalfeldensis]SEP20817.1 DNA-binding transcriptional regulator, AcrR family [Amycolatopsis saalfeldensis]
MATRHLSVQPADQNSRRRFLDAALAVLTDRGVAGLTVRGVAEAAGASTITVYTRFGGRTGLLDALYERAFDLMREQLLDVPPETEDGLADLIEVALAYRRFALENPARYALMYERSVHDFDPDPDLRTAVMRTTFVMFVDKIRRISEPGMDLQQLGYLLWTSMHGLVSVELTMRSQTPLSDWFIENTDEANEDVYRTGVRAMCTGLGLRT